MWEECVDVSNGGGMHFEDESDDNHIHNKGVKQKP